MKWRRYKRITSEEIKIFPYFPCDFISLNSQLSLISRYAYGSGSGER